MIAFVFFNWLVPEKSQPEWVKDAHMKPLLQSTGDELIALLPDDPEGYLNKFRKSKAATEEAVPDSDVPSATPPANAPAASPPAAPPPAAPSAPSPATPAPPPPN